MNVSLRSSLFAVLLLLWANPAVPEQPAMLQRIQYNHPGLVVDLGVGLWAWPLPMDYDGDGDLRRIWILKKVRSVVWNIGTGDNEVQRRWHVTRRFVHDRSSRDRLGWRW